MKTKKIISILIGIVSLFSFTLASDLAWFIVSIDPSTVKVWEPADLIVKAVNSNGDIIENYVWDVVIMVTDGNTELDINDYVVPNEWVYSFTEQDMWTKVFSKGLIVNKEWDYQVTVEDFETSNNWKWDIKVISQSWTTKWTVDIITPQDGETIKNSDISIAWTAKWYANTKIQVIVDDKIKGEWITDSSWNYQIDVLNVSNWDHNIKIEVVDINENVVAESDIIKINVDAQRTLYKWITIFPEKKVNIGTKVSINVKVDPSVSSATLNIANYGEYPMNRKNIEEFTAEITANILWKSDISLNLTTNNWTQNYNNIDEIVVVEKMAIKEVIFKRDNNENIINLDWKFTWQIPKFKVLYGTEPWKYSTNDIIVEENKYTIEHIDETKTYFVKIVPVDSNGNSIWEESKEITVEPNMKEVATCNIDNIETKIVSSKGKYYLTWDKVDGAVKYAIFKWDNKDNLDQIYELTWTKYQLPFNPNAKKDEYAYFAVKAVCDDNTMKQIGNVRKVKVWPMDWLLYAIFITFIIYWLKLIVKSE